MLLIQSYLEAQSTLSILEIVTSGSRAVEGLEVNKARTIEIGAHAANSHDGLTATFHYLWVCVDD